MRYLATATMAASVLAIGLKIDPAVSLPLGGKVNGADIAIQKVQQEKGQAPGAGGGAGKGSGQGGPAAREPGGGGGATRGGGGKREGGGMREGGAQFRSGERGGDRDRGMRGDRDRGRAEVDRDRDRRRGGVYFGFGPGGPSFGYGQARGCHGLRRRALETDSPYWWRRYRACRG